MTEQNDPFAGMEETKVEYNNIKFGKVGDWFKGTLTDNTRTMVNNLSPKKELQTVFEFKVTGGSFHDINDKVVAETPTELVAGDFWSFITSKPAILNQMKDAKLGQVVGFRFSEEKEAKTPGFNKSKIIKVYKGDMDPSYQGETAQDQG